MACLGSSNSERIVSITLARLAVLVLLRTVAKSWKKRRSRCDPDTTMVPEEECFGARSKERKI